MVPLMRQFATEAQRLRNRQSERQLDGVVACRDLALQPFQAVGSGPGPHRPALGLPGGRAGPSVIVVSSWYDPHMPTPFGRSIRHRERATDFLETNAGIAYCKGPLGFQHELNDPAFPRVPGQR